MINNYKKYFIFIFLTVFMLLNMPAQAKWWIFGQGNDEVNINYLYLNKNSYEESGSKLTLYKQNLIDGNIEISGKASVRSGKIGAVYVSRDNKQTWEKAALNDNGVFRYTFAPDLDTKYDLYIKIIDTTGKTNVIDETYKQISIIDKDMTSVVRETLDAIIRAYENEETNLFMTFVSPTFTGDEVVLNSAIRKDFNAFDLIKINFYINNISTSPDGKTYVAISYQRTVVSTKSGNTYSDNGNTELVFVHENGKEKIFSMKNPLIFGLSDAGNVATGTIQATNNAPIILVDNSGNVDAKPFRQAINIIEDGADINSSGSSDIQSGTIVMNDGSPTFIEGYEFNYDSMAGDILAPPSSIVEGIAGDPDIDTVSTAVITGTGSNIFFFWHNYAIKLPDNKYMLLQHTGATNFKYRYQPNGTPNF
jgi:hypothetical protein